MLKPGGSFLTTFFTTKNIQSSYNLLNLPYNIRRGANELNFSYFADGSVYEKSNGEDVKRYVANFEIINDELANVYHNEGRFIKTEDGFRSQYFLRDHLGNTAVVFEDRNKDGIIDETEDEENEVLQRNYYYPFGLEIKSLNLAVANPEMKYTYNGKEIHDDFDIGWSNYGARFYDPAIARFTTIDPLTEQFPHQSGYVYADNDPIGKIDFMGLSGESTGMGINESITRIPTESISIAIGNNFHNESIELVNSVTRLDMTNILGGLKDTRFTYEFSNTGEWGILGDDYIHFSNVNVELPEGCSFKCDIRLMLREDRFNIITGSHTDVDPRDFEMSFRPDNIVALLGPPGDRVIRRSNGAESITRRFVDYTEIMHLGMTQNQFDNFNQSTNYIYRLYLIRGLETYYKGDTIGLNKHINYLKYYNYLD